MISQALSLGSLFLDLAKLKWPENKEIAEAVDYAGKAKHAYNVLNTSSVHQSASRAVIAPLVAIEDTIIHKEYANDLMQVVQIRDTIAVLTHLGLQGAVGTGVKISDLIGEIQPNRSGMMALAGVEAIGDTLPTKDKKNPEGITVDAKPKELVEYSPLSIGKVVTAQVYNDSGVAIPFLLTFRQTAIPLSYASMLNTFKGIAIDESFNGRKLKKAIGQITTPEFLSGKDIVKERFRIANNDMSKYYSESSKREAGNKMAAIRTGTISMNTLANTIIMTQDSLNQIELEIGRRLSHENGRDKIFKEVKANTIVVCNEDRGIFTFYSIASSLPETFTRKDLEIKSKGGNNSNTLEDLVKLIGS